MLLVGSDLGRLRALADQLRDGGELAWPSNGEARAAAPGGSESPSGGRSIANQAADSFTFEAGHSRYSVHLHLADDHLTSADGASRLGAFVADARAADGAIVVLEGAAELGAADRRLIHLLELLAIPALVLVVDGEIPASPPTGPQQPATPQEPANPQGLKDLAHRAEALVPEEAQRHISRLGAKGCAVRVVVGAIDDADGLISGNDTDTALQDQGAVVRPLAHSLCQAIAAIASSRATAPPAPFRFRVEALETERGETAAGDKRGEQTGSPAADTDKDAVDSPGDRTKARLVRGTLLAGRIAPGEAIVEAESGAVSRVHDITGALMPTNTLVIELETALALAPGALLGVPDARPEVADQVAAQIVWLGPEPLLPGRPYRMACGPRRTGASVSKLKYKIDLETLKRTAAPTLDAGEVGFCNLAVDREVAFDPFGENRSTGAFELINPFDDRIVAHGQFAFGLRRASNIPWQALDVTKSARARIKGQRPCCLWFTGLSGSGKSTIANLLERRLNGLGHHTYVLDGDNVRHGLCRDLGFTDADRVENIRRVAEVARLMVDSGLIVMAAFISPFRSERRLARSLFEDGEFLEVFLDTPLEVCEARDPKGLYAKARRGEIANFTGISSPYEPPECAELILSGYDRAPEDLVTQIVEELRRRGYI